MATLTIDGQLITVPDGTRLFDACREARGEDLPHFCYHPDLSVAGVCRLCQVEIEGLPKLTIACNTTVRDGMVVQTRSKRVQQAVQQILEMHLINHPVDCPICDQAGECGLQDQYMAYGLYESEVAKADKVRKAKVQVIGPQVILDQERCVLCTRCVRFCDEVTGTRELGIFNRGDRAEIGVAPGRRLDNNYSLNTVDICPVGALTSRDFRFQKRVWLLRATPTICPGCATGCNLRADHEGGRIYRLVPRRNDEVNGPWACDLGRLSYKDIHAESRLAVALARGEGGLESRGWQEARAELFGLLKPGGVAFALADPRQSLEELVLFKRLGLRLAGEAQLAGGIAGEGMAESDGILLAADRRPNRQALRWLELPEIAPARLAETLRGARGTLLVFGGDPFAHAEIAAAAGRLRVVYLGTHLNATARAAQLVVPLAAWAEKDALWVNGRGRIQRGQRAVAAPGAAREDWRVLADLLDHLGDSLDLPGLAAVRRLVAQELGLADLDVLNRLPVGGLQPELPAKAPTQGE
ncbi:MAG TPA: 2Fe-2S iron-sulfur cluster-binding protein [Candidatus Krumholzibacteria bacterium]|nr:2Fe-2S iron-sulfur cluster-binding protein [Candidatus Krumholzibacteria bacterium]HPD71418.1 2Fe-2S iron-sulfur cluster-binding protein [Candidatus Krumholzibacteria bacterium]HRY41649.1 2Fe-2S iron-sulfur cluster-binding protein [Candidatus Krumholzibacteria bacterium]